MEANEPITNESKNISISDLKSFTIRGLFGYKDIVLPLDKEVLILIAENGAGKTNILNIVYQVLSSEMNLTQLFNCKLVSIELMNDNPIDIDFNLKKAFLNSYLTSLETQQPLSSSAKSMQKSSETLKNFPEYVKNNRQEVQQAFIEAKDNQITFKRIKNLNLKILYFPIYRRIEEYLQILGYEEFPSEKFKIQLVKFRMEDIESHFQHLKPELNNIAKQFSDICNKYLKPNKEIIYNQSTAEIYIKQTRNNERIELNNLSSGEKQIISLFSKVYLEAEEDFILIIDEPELSISVEWQQMLLPDIMKSGKCKRLIAATHSPFIFDNELDHCAYALNQFVTEH